MPRMLSFIQMVIKDKELRESDKGQFIIYSKSLNKPSIHSFVLVPRARFHWSMRGPAD